MGWAILLLLLALALGALWLLGVRDGFFKAAAAALLVGATGYAVQGRPDLSGAPAQAGKDSEVLPLTEARHAFFGRFTPAESWLVMSEALARDGETEEAIGLLQNAVRRYPGDAQLWIALGNALVDHAHGLTPPAELAYKRAAEMAPGHPAPPFFYGLALARSGDRQAAVTLWTQILQTGPKDAAWRPLVEQGVAALSKPSAARPQAGS
jgi:cytochrome c-type biogenesis protein CcmH